MNEELLKRLGVLAEELGVTADHIWGILVKQAGVWSSLCVVTFCLVVLAVAVFLIYKAQ